MGQWCRYKRKYLKMFKFFIKTNQQKLLWKTKKNDQIFDSNNQFVTSNDQTTNLVFPNFFHEIFSVEQLRKKKQTLFIGPKLREKKICFGPIKSLLFQLLKLRKNRGKNWGKQNWLFGGLMSRTRYKIALCKIHNFIKNDSNILSRQMICPSYPSKRKTLSKLTKSMFKPVRM